ncbi:helix-turn-helix transcriptional regulator [Variovorax sp. PAMC26660]|uniref:helix-turn-helix transcriptional regulator n=1 Tax=Variovorax sp. PAMC26660 TaxID=2762322 RepID=UPI001C9A7016|nr:helix-turn-helix transcriptional regulator [Variovorax sp. PAMC26660]
MLLVGTSAGIALSATFPTRHTFHNRCTSACAFSPGGILGVNTSGPRLSAHRGKLPLSAADHRRLVGVTGQAVYNWEQGKARPKAEQLERLAFVRGLGKREVAELLNGT